MNLPLRWHETGLLLLASAILFPRVTAASSYSKSEPIALGCQMHRASNVSLFATSPETVLAIYLDSCPESQSRTAVFAQSSHDGGRSWSSPLLLSNNPAQEGLSVQQLFSCFDGVSTVYAYWQECDQAGCIIQARLNISNDSGLTWLENPIMPAAAPYSKIACDREGNVCLVGWTAAGEEVINVSHDRGQVWLTSPIPIETVSGAVRSEQVVMAGNGFVHVLLELVDSLRFGDPPQGPGFYIVSSPDAGQSWMPVMRVDNGIYEGARSAILVADGLENVAFAWTSHPAGVPYGDVLVRSSQDNALSFGHAVTVNRSSLGAASLSDLKFGCGGNLIALFSAEEIGSTSRNLFVNVSTDAGRSFLDDGLKISHTTTQDLRTSCLSVGAGGLVAAHWATTSESYEGSWWVNASRDGGFSWLPRELRLDRGRNESRLDAAMCSPAAFLPGGFIVFPWGEENSVRSSFDAYVVAVSPQVILSAGSRTHWLPAEGGVVVGDLLVYNGSQTAYRDIITRIDLRLPDGSTSTLLGPITLRQLPPGRRVSRERSFGFPGDLPSGHYELTLHLGAPIDRAATVCVMKLR